MLIFSATVLKGEGKGKTIGFPTINLEPKINLEEGVYLIKTEIGNKIFSGLMHFGLRKTFDNKKACEVYLKNFHGNVYGKKVIITVGKKIRDIKKFLNQEDLINQIKKDLTLLKNV